MGIRGIAQQGDAQRHPFAQPEAVVLRFSKGGEGGRRRIRRRLRRVAEAQHVGDLPVVQRGDLGQYPGIVGGASSTGHQQTSVQMFSPPRPPRAATPPAGAPRRGVAAP